MGGPGSGKRPNVQRQWQILQLRGEGLTVTEIAQRLGITRQAVSNCCRRLGLKFKAHPSGFRRAGVPTLSEAVIVDWARAYEVKHGRPPSACSGRIDGTTGETWNKVDQALRKGFRGLPGGSSLPQLLRHQPRREGAAPARGRLTAKQILRWADLHFSRTGSWPRWDSGPVADAPGELWRRLDCALIAGDRGLPGGSTLFRLLKENGRSVQRSNGWTAEEETLLGKLPDREVAARVGRTEVAVAARRRQLGILKRTQLCQGKRA